MEKFLVKEQIGEFFQKMYKACEGKDIEISLIIKDNKIQIYNRDTYSFEDIRLEDEKPTIDRLIKLLSE